MKHREKKNELVWCLERSHALLKRLHEVIVDHGGDQEDMFRILSDDMLAQDIGKLVMDRLFFSTGKFHVEKVTMDPSVAGRELAKKWLYGTADIQTLLGTQPLEVQGEFHLLRTRKKHLTGLQAIRCLQKTNWELATPLELMAVIQQGLISGRKNVLSLGGRTGDSAADPMDCCLWCGTMANDHAFKEDLRHYLQHPLGEDLNFMWILAKRK